MSEARTDMVTCPACGWVGTGGWSHWCPKPTPNPGQSCYCANCERMSAERDAARAEVERLTKELDYTDTLNDKIANLLTGVANALKGDPAPLHLHDWSDLPEVAAAIIAERKDWRETYGKLRWGVVADGAIIIACVRKQRAEQLAALGAQHTPGVKEVVAKRMPLHLAPEPPTQAASREGSDGRETAEN